MLLPDRFMRHLPRWDPETRLGFLPHQVAPRRPPPQGSHHPSPQHRLTETSSPTHQASTTAPQIYGSQPPHPGKGMWRPWPGQPPHPHPQQSLGRGMLQGFSRNHVCSHDNLP